MSLESDVRRLEQQAGMGEPESEYCTCGPDQIVVVWGDDKPEPEEICPECGKPRERIVIDLDWGDGL